MSLDVYLTATVPTRVFEGNITHNLGGMANEAGVYDALWSPEEICASKACNLITLLERGVSAIEVRPGTVP